MFGEPHDSEYPATALPGRISIGPSWRDLCWVVVWRLSGDDETGIEREESWPTFAQARAAYRITRKLENEPHGPYLLNIELRWEDRKWSARARQVRPCRTLAGWDRWDGAFTGRGC